MFPIEAIILRKIRIDERRIVMTCFSSEYGKIDIFHRESPGTAKLDILSHFTGQIRTKEHNTLSSIYRMTGFSPTGNYELYDAAGWCVSVLYSLLPLGLPYPKLFQLLKNIVHDSSLEHHDFLYFLLHTCRDFGITNCDIVSYIDLLGTKDGQLKVRCDIEGWISAYKVS
jgi:recombinational DNA repair protein (RecF pathway)